MDPIERAVSERLGGLQDETRWRSASIFLNADAPALRPSRRRWFAWAVPAVVLAAAVAALAAFTLGGVFTLGGKPAPAAPTGQTSPAPGTQYCQQLTAKLELDTRAAKASTVISDPQSPPNLRIMPRQSTPYLLTIVNTGEASCWLPSVGAATWTLSSGAVTPVDAVRVRPASTLLTVKPGAAAYAEVLGYTAIAYCSLQTENDPTKDTLTVDFTAGVQNVLDRVSPPGDLKQPVVTLSGFLGGCGEEPLSYAPMITPLAASRAAAEQYLLKAAPLLGDATTTQTPPIRPNGNATNPDSLPCLPAVLSAELTGGYGSGGVQYWDIALRNKGDAACALQGTPALGITGETDAASHAVSEPAPLIQLNPGTTAYVRISAPEPNWGTQCTTSPVASLDLSLPNGAGVVSVPDADGRISRCAGETASFQVWPFSVDKSLGPWGDVQNGATLCSPDQLDAEVSSFERTKDGSATAVGIQLRNGGDDCYLIGAPTVTWLSSTTGDPIGTYAAQPATAKQSALHLAHGMSAALVVWVYGGTQLSGLTGATSDQCVAESPAGLELELTPSAAEASRVFVPLAVLPACTRPLQQLVVDGPLAYDVEPVAQ